MIADLRGQTALVAVADAEMAQALIDELSAHGARCVGEGSSESEGRLSIFIHEGIFAATQSMADFADEAKFAALPEAGRSFFAALAEIKRTRGEYPRYAIALSSPAAEHFALGADFAAAGEAALEALCRYASHRLLAEDTHLNVIRYRRRDRADTALDVARAAVALCSGLMDAVRGEVLTVDRGRTFCDNAMRLFDERARLGSPLTA